MILSAPVPDATQSYGVSQIQAPMGPVGHFSQAGAKATVQIKSLRDRPITIQQHTPSERRRGREGEGEGRSCCLEGCKLNPDGFTERKEIR